MVATVLRRLVATGVFGVLLSFAGGVQAQDWWTGCCSFWGWGSLEGQYTFSKVPNPTTKPVELEAVATVTSVQTVCKNNGGNIGSPSVFVQPFPLPPDSPDWGYFPSKRDKQQGQVVAKPDISTQSLFDYLYLHSSEVCHNTNTWTVYDYIVKTFDVTITVYALVCDSTGVCTRSGEIYEQLIDTCTLKSKYSVLKKPEGNLFDDGVVAFDCVRKS